MIVAAGQLWHNCNKLTSGKAEAERHENSQAHAMQVGSLPQDSDPLLRLGLALKLDRVLDLGKLVVDKRVVAVAVAVVFDEKVKGLGLAAVGH